MSEFDMNLLIEELQERNANLNKENNELLLENQRLSEEEIKEYTNKFLEVWELISKQFGKLFDELIRIRNDLGLNLEDFIKEEPQEHKIPEKLNLNTYAKIGTEVDRDLIIKINEIIDYLERIE